MERRMILLIAFMATIGAKANAQTTVATAGGEAGTMSYTIGQIAVEPAETAAGSLTPGVQQAYEITIVDGIDNRYVTLEAEVYPNPVTDLLILRVDDAVTTTLHYTLTDANGRTISAADIASAQSAIDMSQHVQGVYFLRVTNGETMVRTFKIVKK